MKTFIGFLACLILGLNAQSQSTSDEYSTGAEMQEQMRMIANTLGLEAVEIGRMGTIMDHKRQQKDLIIKQIDQLKVQISEIDAQAELALKELLTPEQWKRYLEEVKPGIDDALKENMSKVK